MFNVKRNGVSTMYLLASNNQILLELDGGIPVGILLMFTSQENQELYSM